MATTANGRRSVSDDIPNRSVKKNLDNLPIEVVECLRRGLRFIGEKGYQWSFDNVIELAKEMGLPQLGLTVRDYEHLHRSGKLTPMI